MPFDQTTSLLLQPVARGTKFAFQEPFFNTFSSQQKCIAMGNKIRDLFKVKLYTIRSETKKKEIEKKKEGDKER